MSGRRRRLPRAHPPEGADPETARELYLMSTSRPDVEFVRITSDQLGSKKMHLPFATA
jgi:hypothetical protein